MQKIKYAKFKASDIIKAIKEGRTPTPGAPGDIQSQSSSLINIDHPQPTNSHPEPTTSVPTEEISFPGIPKTNPLPTSPIIPDLSEIEDPIDEETYNDEDRQKILAAGKHAKFAMSALLYDDIKTAMSNLELALEMLRPLKQYEI